MKRLILSLVGALILSCGAIEPAQASNYIGEYAPGDTIDCKFATYQPSTGATFTLGGTPAISAYKDNSTTQSTTGITLSADFDTVTGLNNVRVTTASDGTFYSAGSYFSLVITTGTVDSVSVTGSEVCSFSLNKEAGLRPTTAGRTVDIASTGEAGVDFDNILFSGNGPIAAFGIIDRGTAQAADASSITLRAGFSTNAANMVGVTAWVYSSTNGLHARCVATAYNNTSKVLTCSGLGEAPTGTVLYVLVATPSSVFGADSITASALAADAGTELGTATWASATRTLTALDEDTTTMDLNATTIGTVTTATNLTNAPTAGDLTATMKASVATAVQTAQGLLTGTCSSGSTTTCVDAGRTEADATLLQDRLVCYSDGWCAMLTTFDPGTDTQTYTKTAPSTRASKTYIIFPSTAQ